MSFWYLNVADSADGLARCILISCVLAKHNLTWNDTERSPTHRIMLVTMMGNKTSRLGFFIKVLVPISVHTSLLGNVYKVLCVMDHSLLLNAPDLPG